MRQQQRATRQGGGFAMGLIVGLLIGLALALGVALYVTKVPVPFINKVPQRSAEHDAAEMERNKNWDPNAPLYGKNPVRPGVSGGSVTPAPGAAPAETAPATTAAVPPQPVAPPASTRDPAAILGEAPAAPAAPVVAAMPALPSADPFSYFVQAGAYGRTEDAERQRARLAMLGFGAKVTEREQSGRTIYRVRLGPYAQKDEADEVKRKIDDAGIDSALVRVQR